MEHQTIQEVQVTYTRPKISTMPRVRSSGEAETVLRQFIDPQRIDYKEFFYVVLLSHSYHVLGISRISEGTTSNTPVNIKEIFQLVIKTNATHFMLAHNHPSGHLQPSDADIGITKQVKGFAKLLDVQLIDHLILTSEGYYSFADNGTM